MNKGKKVLFVTHSYAPQTASTRIIYSVSQFLVARGVEVHILVHAKGRFQKEEVIGGERIHRIRKSNVMRLVRRLLVIPYNHPANPFARLLQKGILIFARKPIYRDSNLVREINRLVKVHDISVVIPVTQMSFCAISAMEAFKKSPKFRLIPYFLDPFATLKQDFSDDRLKQKLEEELFSYAETIVLTPEMYKEFQDRDVTSLPKMVSLGFPMVIRPNLLPAKDDIAFDQGKVNCLFIGNFDAIVRNPDYIFDLFRGVQNENIVFHIGGGGCRNPETKALKEELGERLQLHGYLSVEAAFNANIHADILINIGNNMTNMLPSKLFGYFSTGKPLVSSYKTLSCPSVAHLIKYPLCLALNEALGVTMEVVKQFEQFCLENKGVSLAFSVVGELYKENTLEYVGNKWLEMIEV